MIENLGAVGLTNDNEFSPASGIAINSRWCLPVPLRNAAHALSLGNENRPNFVGTKR